MSEIQKAGRVVRQSFKTLLRDPQIIVYPILGLIFIQATGNLIGNSVFHRWYSDIFPSVGAVVPHKAGVIIGLVGFTAFYAAFIGAFFTCAVSAAVLAKLEGRRTQPLYGLIVVGRRLARVSSFALLSVFMFPVGVYAQRRKLPKGVIGVAGSSLTLHMSSVAPAILTTQKRFGETVRDAVDTLGEGWKTGLILKIATYLAITIFIVLPKLFQHHFRPTASNVGWVVSLEVAASGLIVFKIINAVFTTVLYHQAKSQK